jgi:hypothetical protein
VAQDERDILAARVRAALANELTSERRMFGGVAFMLGGNMLCCASRRGLMVRVGREQEPAALKRPHAAPCLGTGRPMAGFLMVDPAGVAEDTHLSEWLDLARAYVTSLPAKGEAKSRLRTSNGPARLRS